MPTIEEILVKARERGYTLHASSGDRSWYSFMNERYGINLQIWVDKEEFELSFFQGMILITTKKIGSFMNDEHFRRFEREIRRIKVDLI